ncbi:enoyl-CoA hydratase/isomerase family protein [Nocardioides houyundeii]|uniref:enoyl-CoA hydratase/isomerase family protein n=1 Tax=Nocardioides houyundeii TaxID=2045452 RepID=UPI000C763B1D|nr:enoyl-CoA hydratase/isomerase family protein [Nocardioides houyundeii]
MGGAVTLRVRRGAVWQVALDRPDRANALSTELVEALHGVLEEAAEARPDALVLRGNDRHFAAGLDLADLPQETDGSLAHRLLRIGLVLERLLTLPCLTVAVVEGAAIGAGADLALACDRRIGTPGASFRFPGSAFGVVLGTARLSSQAGAHRALDGGRRRDASEALGEGLLTELADDPEPCVDAVLRTWALTAPIARPGLLAQARAYDADGALAALARSVAEPGLQERVLAYAATPRQPSRQPSRQRESV